MLTVNAISNLCYAWTNNSNEKCCTRIFEFHFFIKHTNWAESRCPIYSQSNKIISGNSQIISKMTKTLKNVDNFSVISNDLNSIII